MVAAEREYGVPRQLLYAIALKERTAPGQKVCRNKNGTCDHGRMGINTAVIQTLSKYGVTSAAILSDECLNTRVGAWLLAKHYAKDASWVHAIGKYNVGSFSSPARTRIGLNYARDVLRYWHALYAQTVN